MWPLWVQCLALAAFLVDGDIMKPAQMPMLPGKPFITFWNAPTEPCKRRYKVDLQLAAYGIVTNPNETLSGSAVTIFYHNRMGIYPHVDEQGNIHHGGIPQSQNVEQHLVKVEADIDKALPKRMFNGLGVIDWENWRPLWVRNWGDKVIYRNLSIDLVQAQNPTWTPRQILAAATKEFESAGKKFMDTTLYFIKMIRPYGYWGFYLFPDCYNHHYRTQPNTYTGECPAIDMARNDLLLWLWQQSSALFPSVYLLNVLKSSPHAVKFVRHRVMEAMRVAKQSKQTYDLPVFVYSMPVYVHTTDVMTQADLVNTIGETASLGAAGLILWGSSMFGRSQAMCELLRDYMNDLFGNYLVNVTSAVKFCSQQICSNHGKCLRKNSTSEAYLHLPSPSFSIHARASRLGKRVSVKGRLSEEEKAQWKRDFKYCRFKGGSDGDDQKFEEGSCAFSKHHQCKYVSITTGMGQCIAQTTIGHWFQESMWRLWINSMAITAFIVVYGNVMKPARYPIVPDKPFAVFWNAPTEPCKRRYQVDLELETFYIVTNPNETLSGSTVTIFYFNRLGNYPHIDKSNNIIYGGVPQNQDILKHLTKVQNDIEKAIPMKMFNGLGVIVWDNWRPLWVRNWGNKMMYQNLSRDLIQRWHPNWSQTSIVAVAKEEFENAARRFMNRTISLLQQMRSYGLWGFYSFPDCYNHGYKTRPATYTGECPRIERERNDQLLWLWKQSTALFPSIFLLDVLKSSRNALKFVRHRLIEAMRVAAQSRDDYDLPVFAYAKLMYTNSTDFLTEEDLVNTIGESAAMGAAGTILWGSATYGRSKAFCALLKNYIAGPLGHYVVNVTAAATMCSQEVCSNNGKCVRKVSMSNAYLHLPSSSFKIEVRATALGRMIHLKGRLERQDKAQWRKDFNCQCYPDWTGLFCEIPCSR